MDVMKASVKGGDRVVVAIQRAIEYIDKLLEIQESKGLVATTHAKAVYLEEVK